FEAIKGRGVKGIVDGREIFVGGPRLLEMLEIELPDNISAFSISAGRQGQSVVYLVVEGKIAGSFALADVIRTESQKAVRDLKGFGIEVAMITGDSQAVAENVADQLSINKFIAEVLPEHKGDQIAKLQQGGKRVAMVGDGVNDAPALARADVGIAIGSGTDVAVESAGIILVNNNPRDVVKVIKLSRESYRKMIQNLAWASGYNIFALPLAAGVMAGAGILLSPAIGALFMSLSTVIVAINAQLLRRVKL
ncbi:MAG: HAD-IC family P-type ATPase, partial [Anaerolineae bacterium]|nr:HAD-IC family P-type ATPase [Anaerolineae bacterium]